MVNKMSDESRSVAIIGAGKIGTVTANKLKTEVALHDPWKNLYIDEFSDYDYVFVCVDTVQNGPEDYADLDSALGLLGGQNYSGTVIIRSTISPRKAKLIEDLYGFKVSLFPEFMPQRAGALILDDSWMIVIGGTPEVSSDVKRLLLDLGYFSNEDSCREVSNYESAIIKLSANSILAAKVVMFNSVKAICDDFESNYETVKDALTLDKRLGAEYHSIVPSPDDGLPGFGGHCLPKDIKTIIEIDKYDFFKAVEEVNRKLGR